MGSGACKLPTGQLVLCSCPLLLLAQMFSVDLLTLQCLQSNCGQMSGDVRLTPFYDAREVMKTISGYVDDINANITELPTRGSESFLCCCEARYATPVLT